MNEEETALVQNLWKVIKLERFRATHDDELPEPNGSIEILDRRGDLIIATNESGSTEFEHFFLVSSYNLTGTPYFKKLLRDWGKEAVAFKRAKREDRIGYVEIGTEDWDDGLYGLLKLLHNQLITNTTVYMALAVAMTADQLFCLNIACVQYYIRAALTNIADEDDPENLVMYLVLASLIDNGDAFQEICHRLVLSEWNDKRMRRFFETNAANHCPEHTLSALMCLRRTLFGYIYDLAFFDRPDGLLYQTVRDPCDWTATFRKEDESGYKTKRLRSLVRDGHHNLAVLVKGLKKDISACSAFRSWSALRHGHTLNNLKLTKEDRFRDKVATVCDLAVQQHFIVCLPCLKNGWSRSAVHEPDLDACASEKASDKQASSDLDSCPDNADFDFHAAYNEARNTATQRSLRSQ